MNAENCTAIRSSRRAGPWKAVSLTEKNTVVNGIGAFEHARHPDRFSTDGRAFTDTNDHTCGNYTSNADGMGTAAGPFRQARRREQLMEFRARQSRLQPAEPCCDGWRRIAYCFIN
jgi:hypothetical protein